jgi:hypothetical protein
MHRSVLLSRLLIVPLLLSISAYADVTTYRATLKPTASSPFPELVGFVALFTESGTLSLGYAGIVTGLEDDLLAAACNATNGCGVHIHNGTSCTNATTQGGHYFGGDVTEDPWVEQRYSSNADGKANFQSVLNIGTIDIEGRVFLGKSFVALAFIVMDAVALQVGFPTLTVVVLRCFIIRCSIQCTRKMEPALVAVSSNRKSTTTTPKICSTPILWASPARKWPVW